MLENQGSRGGGKEKNEKTTTKYIVNSNYAGNDALTSSSRFIVNVTRGGIAEKAMESVRKGKYPEFKITDDVRRWLGYLGIVYPKL